MKNKFYSLKATGETFHYCCYVPQDGSLYELDGLKAWPINHGKTGTHWLEKAKSVISGRIEKAFQKDPGPDSPNRVISQKISVCNLSSRLHLC